MEQVLDTTGEAMDTLDQLGQQLARRGYLVMLDCSSTRPRLELLNRTRPRLGGSILCEHGTDGWWLWWAWAERIAPANDFTAALAVIDNLLQADAAA